MDLWECVGLQVRGVFVGHFLATWGTPHQTVPA